MMTTIRVRAFDRQAVVQTADWLAFLVAVSLPWSTSAAGIFIALWLAAALASLDAAAVRREIATAAGGLPVLLWALAALGTLWADVSWSERFGGLGGFNRLLMIPLLLTQFRRSDRGMRVLYGFFASVSGVLLLSWLLVLFPSLPWRPNTFGVPVKDYIVQSEDFLLCTFALFAIAFDDGKAGRWLSAAGLIVFASAFLANIAFVVTGRSTLLVVPVLLLLLAWRQFGWKGLVGAGLVGCLIGLMVSIESPYLSARLKRTVAEFQAYRSSDAPNSTALHLELLRKSLSIVAAAPIIGHGTGSIPEQFDNAAIGQTGASAVTSVNPHNQIFAVAIQLGLVGAALLVAMWTAHIMLFRGSGLTSWLGLTVVVQNIVASLFNSHLFDFTQGWIYVFGVGVAGGMAQRKQSDGRVAPPVAKP